MILLILHFRYWEVDHPKQGETCLSQQPDGSCKSVYIPSCVDRTVYCSSPLPNPKNSNFTFLVQPNPNNLLQLGTSFSISCPIEHWYFNYSVPKNLTSYYYSNNINNTTLSCNKYGLVSALFLCFVHRPSLYNK